MKLSGNTILISGGGTGIGRSLAKQFLALNNKVVICGRREDRLKEVAQEFPGIHYKRCDIGNDADRQELFAYIKKDFPDMNVLINNAAIQSNYDLMTGTEGLKKVDEDLYISLNAHIHMTGLFMPLLLQAKEAAVVNVSSVLAFMPLTRIPIYCAAKAALHAYTLVLRKQLEDTNVKIHEVAPPKVETEISLVAKDAKPGTEDPVGMDADVYVAAVIEALGKGVELVLYPPTEKFIYEMTRAESEILRLK